MTKKVSNDSSELKIIPLLTVLYKKLFVILTVVILFTAGSVGYSLARNKTTYTASKPVMFVTNITATDISTWNDVAISKIYLPDVALMIKTPAFIEKANALYGGESLIESDKIEVKYGEDSLIFTLSYTDYSSEDAKGKLQAIVDSARFNLKNYIQASEVTLKDVQNKPDVKPNKKHTTFGFYGFMIGLVVSCAGVLIAYALDDTVKDKKEIESLTGANLLGCIEDAYDKKKK